MVNAKQRRTIAVEDLIEGFASGLLFRVLNNSVYQAVLDGASFTAIIGQVLFITASLPMPGEADFQREARKGTPRGVIF